MNRFVAALALTVGLVNAQPPEARITNGAIQAVLYLPDADRGYYRGTRFDWSGVIARLEYKHHSYFGVWFPKYEPTLHDAITGPVEEFRSDDGALGFGEAKPGELFVKIGVGILQKPDNKPYQFTRPYKIVSTGVWVVRPHPESVEFEQDLRDVNGYGYEYSKRVRLADHKPELILEHTLKNTGKRMIETEVYNHDFYVIDGQPTGPAFSIQFPFRVKPEDSLGNAAEVRGDEITYTRPLGEGGHDTVAGYLTGYGKSAKDDDIRVENSRVGAGVEESINRPISKLYLWSIRTTVCPEVYIALKIAPGESARWQTKYRFYTFRPEEEQGRP
ncbi:MAG TPA: hypothetical protein VKX25_18805 [Bryobacteraceae bacterium]|nr:hypothetical protein [Bryobacteraceae bacterium]